MTYPSTNRNTGNTGNTRKRRHVHPTKNVDLIEEMYKLFIDFPVSDFVFRSIYPAKFIFTSYPLTSDRIARKVELNNIFDVYFEFSLNFAKFFLNIEL